MHLASLTDDELVRSCNAITDLSPLESELVARLQRALEEIDRLIEEGFGGDAGDEGQAQNQGLVEGSGDLAL